jgi:hypothetical protein
MFKHCLTKIFFIAVSFLAFANYALATNVTLSYGNTDLLVAVNRDAGVLGSFDFTDVFDLDLNVPASFSFVISELEEPAYNIVNGSFNYGLYDISNNLVTTPSILNPGAYQLRVFGKADGFFGGQYLLSFNVSSPVPEPELSAFMLIGLSIIGFGVLRKSRN